MKKYLLFLLFFISLSSYAFCSDIVYFSVKPPSKTVKLADKIDISFTAAIPQHYSILPDTKTFDTSSFDLISFTNVGQGSSGTLKTESFSFNCKVFSLGISTFPAITWNLISENKVVSSAKSPEFQLDVKPLYDNEAIQKEDIRDIYPPFKFHNWFLMVLIALVVIGIISYVIKKLNAKKYALFTRPPWVDSRTAYQRGYDRTVVLENSPLLEKNKIKEFYTGMAEILRVFLYEEYSLDARLLTTNDITRKMKNIGVSIKSVSSVKIFLQKSDLVKFAKSTPESINADLMSLRDLLQALSMEHAPEITTETAKD